MTTAIREEGRSVGLLEQTRHVALHLRLPVQVTLAPLYLWGVFGAAGRLSAATVTAFLALHIFLYGGATLFNSYYDRDDGPVIGMERPLTLPPWALPFSLLWQALGALLALTISPPFVVFYLAYAVAGILYSHPVPRLKGNPYLSTLLILVFQGWGGFLAGWLAGTGGALPLGDARFWGLGLVAAGATLGLYPLTQVFQIDEDAARGDRTLAMVLGPTRSFAFAVVLLSVAAVAGLGTLAAMGCPLDGLLMAGGFALMVAATVAIGARFAQRPLLVSFRRIAALQFASAVGFGAFVALQFVHLF